MLPLPPYQSFEGSVFAELLLAALKALYALPA